MATAREDRDPVCPICVDSFKIPKVLECGHSYCLDCLKDYVDEGSTGYFLCAVCRKEIKIPDNGLETLTTIWALERAAPVVTISPKCPNHVHKDVECYCTNCDIGICYKCLYLNHNGHGSIDLESEATRVAVNEEFGECENNIRGFLDDAKTVSNTLSNSLTTYSYDECKKVDDFKDEVIKEIEQKAERAKTFIRHQCGEKISEVEKWEDEIMGTAEDVEFELISVLSSTTNESIVSRLQGLSKLKQIQAKINESKYALPEMGMLEWTSRGIHVPDNLGTLQTKLLQLNLPKHLKFLQAEDPGDELKALSPVDGAHGDSLVDGAQVESLVDGAKIDRLVDGARSYVFHFDIENWDGEKHHISKDIFYVTAFKRLVWRCFCNVSQEGELGAYVVLLEEDNEGLDHCVIDYRLAISPLDTEEVFLLKQENNATVYPKRGEGCDIPFHVFGDQFKIKFDIFRIRQVVNKV